MRLHQLLSEQTHEDLARDALITLLATNHAMGIESVATSKLLKSLERRNFFVNAAWLKDQISNIDIVDADASDDDTIKIRVENGDDTSDQTMPTDDEQAQRDTVDRMAQRALNKRI
jgi:hypothetical protein